MVELCKQENVPFYDFSDITWAGSNDSETIYGFHGNERCYARITLKLSESEILRPHINFAKVKSIIAHI